MPGKSYAVIGATGQIGHALAESLLKKGNRVRAIGRNTEKLEKLKSQGAEIISASFTDAAAIQKAFSGVDAVFSMIPPDYTADDPGAAQDKVGEIIVGALQAAKVTKVVSLSSIGAQHPSGTGPITGLYRQEQRLNALPSLDVVHLRPSSFMENFFWSIPVIKNHGIIGSSIKGDDPAWMVATADIAEKASWFLDKLEFKGKAVFELVGPRKLTRKEATSILGQAIGKPQLPYVEMSYEDELKATLASGMKPAIANQFSEMSRAHNEGKLVTTQEITAEHQGSTSFEAFAKQFAAIYSR